MLKIDMQKAYDSVEWSFLEQILTCLNFPEIFVNWIMKCVTTVSYAIVVNGKQTPPFSAKKGLRQGDPLSSFLFVLVMEYLSRLLKTLKNDPDFNHHPKCAKLNIIQLGFADDLLLFTRGDMVSVQKVYDCFMAFSASSGLIANKDKSSIYFGGVDRDTQDSILESLQFSKGQLPFRYLGVPLSFKRISIIQCQPLLDKMVGRITHWTSKFLSYAGRLQLIQSVLFSIQTFWAQVFILPKKVLKSIETICRSYLWTGSLTPNKKALVAWEQLCLPKSTGGLNILHVQTWNRAAICKLMWNLCRKKDKLWVQWVHIYYGKGKPIWTIMPKQASWMLRIFFKAAGHLTDAGYDLNGLQHIPSMSIKEVYTKLRGNFQKVPWRKILCNNSGAPKWNFILYLVIMGRLYTKDRLMKWKLINEKLCPLCGDEDESIDHLFFLCDYSTIVWGKLLAWQGHNRSCMRWTDELAWMLSNANGRNAAQEMFRIVLSCCIYTLWQERNQRVFQMKSRPQNVLIRKIIQDAVVRASLKPRLARRVQELDFYP